MNTAIEEKRRHPRVGDELNFALTVVSDESQRRTPASTFYYVTEDISASGMRFIANENLPSDSVLKVQLALDNSLRTVTHFARVRWIKKVISDRFFSMGMEVNSIGVEFTDSMPEDLRIWSEYVNRKLSAAS
jgi:c-di-GMP-binding flagellar brake protein YcgR